jgi:hypothetical protein
MKLFKKHFKFEKSFDFNELAYMIDRNNFKTDLNGNWNPSFIFDNAINIKNTQHDIFFSNLYSHLENKHNPNKLKSDIHVFFCMSSGGKSVAHFDLYDVYIIGLHGKTMYRNDKEEVFVEEGDVLYLKKGEEHRAIGITPRIIASYAFYDEKI